MHRLVYVSNYLDVMIDSYHNVTTHTHKLWDVLNVVIFQFFRVVKYLRRLVDYTSSWDGIEHC